MSRPSRLFIIWTFFLAVAASAAPTSLTYQGRILRADGSALEYNNVSFIFQITDPTGGCVIFQEQVTGYDMTNSGGVFDSAIGLGSRSFPASGSFTVLDALNNSTSLACQGTANYTPALDDGRRLRVQFYDGTGWRTVAPDNIIRSVPYAGYAQSAQKLGTYLPNDFLLKAGLPTCGAGTFLSWDGTALSCIPVSGTSGGTVTNVTSANAYLSVGNGSSTPSLTLNVGTSANTVAAGNDARFSDARAPNGSAGGDLSGTYPNPSVAKILGRDLDTTAPTSGQFLKFTGASKWAPASLAIGDVSGLSTSLSGMVAQSQFPASCAASQTLTFLSPSGSFTCSAISISGANFASQSANLVLASPDLASGTPTFRALTTNDLPTTIASGLWTASGSDIYRAGGKVGIGTNSPSTPLHVYGSNAAAVDQSVENTASGTGASARFYLKNDAADTLQISQFSSGYTSSGATVASGGIIRSTGAGGLSIATTNAAGDLRFYTAGAAAANERLRILSSGNVGIGTATPGVALDVYGTIRATAFSGPLTSTTTSVGTGTTGAPSMTFSGDTNTGFYDAASNDTLGVVTGGTNIFNFTSTGLTSPTTGGANITTGAGSVGAPTFSFAGDPGTGWWRPSAGTMAASTGGAERMRIDSSGNVGIGTTASASLLHVDGGGITSERYNALGGFVVLRSAAGTQASPTALPQSANAGILNFNGYDGTNYQNLAGIIAQPTDAAGVTSSSSAGALYFLTTPTGTTTAVYRMFIGQNGNVGIGTTSPAAPLSIYQAPSVTSGRHFLANMASGSANGNPEVDIGYLADGTNVTANLIHSGNTLPLAFNIGSTEWMRLSTSGNLGIGTTTPNSPLHVVSNTGSGNIRIDQFNATTGASYFLAVKGRGTSSSPTGGLNGDDVGAFISRAWGTTGIVGGSGAAMVGIAAEDQTDTALGQHLAFKTTPTGTTGMIERMRISANGNVGIGTATPMAGLSIFKPAINSGREYIQTFSIADDSNTIGYIANGTANNGLFAPVFGGYRAGANSKFVSSLRGFIDAAGDVAGYEPIVDVSVNITDSTTDPNNGTFTNPVNRNIFGIESAGTYALMVGPTGNVGIGTTGPITPLQITNKTYIDSVNLDPIVSGTSSYFAKFTNAGSMLVGTNRSAAANETDFINFSGSSEVGGFSFFAVNTGAVPSAPIMFLNKAGNVGIGTYTPVAKLDINSGTAGANTGLAINTTSTAANTYVSFKASGSVIGSISSAAGANVAYNTTSDIRLKAGFQPVLSPMKTLNAIEVSNFYYLADPAQTRMDGFKAQQLYQVLPYAVTKPEEEVDADGKINAWQADYSKVVPLITAAIKEFYARWFADSASIHRDIAAIQESKDKEISELKARLQKQEQDFNARFKQQDQELQAIKKKLGL